MAEQQIYTATLDNGLVLLGERMDWVESAAFCFLLPCGARMDPEDRLGLSNLLCDMVQRGAGSRDTRQLLLDLELLGIDYGGSVSNSHTSFSGATLADRLTDGLEIFADIIQRPHLPEAQLEDSRNVCIQELRAMEDDLARQVMFKLRDRHYPAPLGRDAHGNLDSVTAIALEDAKQHWQRHYVPRGAILAVAGKFDWEPLKDKIESLFGNWSGSSVEPGGHGDVAGGYTHLQHDSSQTHMAVAYRALPASHEDYYRAWAAVSVLGDGESSRLFTQLREERGLCYTYSANYHVLKDLGSILCYAGTTTARAQETLDVMLREILKMREGVTADEVRRLQTRCKTALVMHQESSRARCGSLASQWHLLGRIRPLEETQAAIDALTCESIGEYLAANPPREFTICTLGEQELEHSVEVS